MKKLLIAILAVAALSHANQCEDVAEARIDELKNCKLSYNDEDQVRFNCSNGSVGLLHKNDSTRFLGIQKYLNKKEYELMVITHSNCSIIFEDKYGVVDYDGFSSNDVEYNSALNLWGYFKRHLVR